MNENEISRHTVASAVEVHRTLGGPGLLESVYEEALVWELTERGPEVKRQVSLPIAYKGHTLASPLRIDLIVGGLVIVECKAVSQYNAIFEAQTLTYLRLMELKLGVVINFGERMVKDGIHRVVNGLLEKTNDKAQRHQAEAEKPLASSRPCAIALMQGGNHE